MTTTPRRGLRLLAGLLALSAAPNAGAAENYKLTADSLAQPGVPAGVVTKHTFAKSEAFPGTERDYWVYVPAQYKPGGPPACVMVFQDGVWYRDPKGDHRAPTVFDNLIHRGEMPVTVGVFVNPGTFPIAREGEKPRSNRSFEYDTLSGTYAKFLEQEILPEVAKTVSLRTDAAGRAICGISSGGICAFTAAWQRPEAFSKVLSHVGSFTNIRGGDAYPGVIRKTPPKPLRVYLQDGAADLDNEHGSWPLGNLQMAASLRYKGYDYKLVYGEGAHNGKHGGVDLPDALRWLWRGEAKPQASQER